ncbi:MAG: hypothetical protein KIS96_12605 [Bauldia sp.]|nr:hypothetical protein [Bauldia sp.]
METSDRRALPELDLSRLVGFDQTVDGGPDSGKTLGRLLSKVGEIPPRTA